MLQVANQLLLNGKPANQEKEHQMDIIIRECDDEFGELTKEELETAMTHMKPIRKDI